MAVTYHSQSPVVNTTSSTLTINKPSGVVSGDLLIAIFRSTDTSSPYTAEIAFSSEPSGWIDPGFTEDGAAGILVTGIRYKIAGGSEPASYTWNPDNGGAFTTGIILRFSGHDPLDPFGDYAKNSSSASTTVNYAAATVERDGSMDLAYAVTLGTTSDVATGISGYTTIFSGPRYNIFTKSVNAGSLSATTSTMDASTTTLSRRLIIQAPITVIDASQSASVVNSSSVNSVTITPVYSISQSASLVNTSSVNGVSIEEVVFISQSDSLVNVSVLDGSTATSITAWTATQSAAVDNVSIIEAVDTLITEYTATQSAAVENVSYLGSVDFSTAFPTYQYLVDWHNSGNFSGPYDDVTAYVKDARWSLGMKQAYQYMPDESECTLTLINTDRRFSPENEDSPIYGLMLPNRRVKVVATNGFDPPETMWYGYLDSINPTPMQYAGPFTTTLKAVGPKQILDRAEINLELLENVTTDEAVAAILEQAQVAPVTTGTWRLGSVGSSELGNTTYLANVTLPQDLEVGIVTLPFVGDNWDRFSTAFEALASVVLAEQGKLFFSRDGTIVFWNRQHVISIDGTDHVFDNTFQGIEYTFGKEVFNNISVTYYPRAISTTADDVVWSLDEPITLAGGESQELQANFSSEEGVKVGAKDVVMPNTGDGTLSFSSGSGTISKWEVNADSVRMTLTNDSPSSDVTFSTIIIKGKKITSFNSQTITEFDNSSISYYGKRSKNIDLKLLTDINDARSIAQNELIRYKQPRGVVRSIRIPNRDMENALLQINLGIGSSIAIGETQTQHSYRYIIIGESHQWKASGKDTVTTFYLEPVSSLSPWRLGTVGRSELGSTTKLGL